MFILKKPSQDVCGTTNSFSLVFKNSNFQWEVKWKESLVLKISKGTHLVLIFCINSLQDQKQHVLFHKTMKSPIVSKYRSALKYFKQPGAKHQQQVKLQGHNQLGVKAQGAELEQ